MMSDDEKRKMLPTPAGVESAVKVATQILLDRLAASEQAIGVALGIAADEKIVAQSRAAALRTIAQMMASASSIGTALARINGGTHHNINVGRADKARTLSNEETAEARQKLRAYPRGEGTRKIFQAPDEPDKHLPPFRIR